MSNISEVRKRVMTIANKLKKTGSSLSESLKLAWHLIKKQTLSLNVKGTSFGKRQQALSHLTHYSKDKIEVHLVREPKNSFDADAVVVIIRVVGKGSYKFGYISKNISKVISILIEKGHLVSAEFAAVVGGPLKNMNLSYGLKINLKIA